MNHSWRRTDVHGFTPNHARRGTGFTLVEIMIVVAIIALLAAIAIPNVLRGRTSANEAAAVGNTRALVSSLEMYRSTNNIYPATANWQAEMYTNPTPPFGPPAFNAASPITVQGFTYTYASGGAQTYTFTVAPVTIGTTGSRGFFVSDAGVVRHCRCGATCTAVVGSNTLDVAPAAC